MSGSLLSGSGQREVEESQAEDKNDSRCFALAAIPLPGVIMCVYVGFENGFTFFVDTLFTDVLHLSKGKVTLSLFWAVMIPSRFLVGHFANHAKKILVAAIVIIPCTMLLLTASSIPAVVMILCVPLRFASGAV